MNIPVDTPKSRRQTKLRVMAHPNKLNHRKITIILRMLLKFCIKMPSMIKKIKNATNAYFFSLFNIPLNSYKNVTKCDMRDIS
jgi:hypothetical protein